MTDELRSLATQGVLRAAINIGNRALVQYDGTHLSGVSPALAQRLAHEIGASFKPVIYDGAGKVFADAHADRWDVAFLAVDAMRAEKVAFTRPYHSIEATFAVRAGQRIETIDQVDQDGVRVLTSTGSAYDMHLTHNLAHAALERSGAPRESFVEFQHGRCDAVAGVRASLEAFFRDDPDIRILPGALTAVHQAMVLPRKDDPRITALDAFVAKAVSDGFVGAHL
ncbi:transporter substrate-binding domain-containing protein [Shimia ponticola]|uniref:transporter substrate-binding domain-containing protein n=1 Tax=Shimia ponticola TaxID=2582893 RepID=UPI0011BDB6D1|nr:transporter substrate-binding domain-containing protein [Shimia ponticola]